MLLMTVIGLLIQVLPEILATVGVSPAMGKLIADLSAGLPALINNLVAGRGATQEALNVLDGFRVEFAAIAANSSIPPSTALTVNSISGAIEDALAANQAARATCDPANLGGLPEDLTTKG